MDNAWNRLLDGTNSNVELERTARLSRSRTPNPNRDNKYGSSESETVSDKYSTQILQNEFMLTL